MAKFQKKTLTKTVETPEEQEQALAKLREVAPITDAPQTLNTLVSLNEAPPKTYKEKYPKATQRVNLDLSQDLYDAIQDHIKKNGQTMKGFFTVAAWSLISKS
ncbi:MAG: hypothetical protein JNL70_19090 [Saprospiraceae bacterium]|nr:hypothetical protein [Saprospiraceae bacterium]